MSTKLGVLVSFPWKLNYKGECLFLLSHSPTLWSLGVGKGQRQKLEKHWWHHIHSHEEEWIHACMLVLSWISIFLYISAYLAYGMLNTVSRFFSRQWTIIKLIPPNMPTGQQGLDNSLLRISSQVTQDHDKLTTNIAIILNFIIMKNSQLVVEQTERIDYMPLSISVTLAKFF